MKNLLIIFIIALSTISCDKADEQAMALPEETTVQPADTATTTGLLLPRKDTSFSSYDNVTDTGIYEYDGNKLIKITWDDDSHETYSYQNGKLANTYYYWGTELVTKKTFVYDGDKLSKFINEEVIDQLEDVTEYTYTTDNTINISVYSRLTDDDDQAEPELTSTGILTLENGNITKFVRTYANGVTDVFTYTFDNKLSAYTNVFGADVLMLAEMEGGKNNYVSYTVNNNNNEINITCTNTYNSEGYLIKSVESDGSGNGSSIYTITY